MPIRIRDVQQAQPVNPIQAAADPISSPRRRAGLQTLNRLYRRFGTTLALCGAGVLGGLIWYYSSIYTLDYLADTFVHVAQFARSEPQWKAFLIPATVSAIEIFLWPQRERRFEVFVLRLLVWLFILFGDIFTTWRGVLPLIQSAKLPFELNVNERGIFDGGVSFIIGGMFAFLPEKILRWVLHDMWELWLAPLVRWFTRSGRTQPIV